MFLRNIQRSDGDSRVERYRSRCGDETDCKGFIAWFRASGISHNIQAIQVVLWRKGSGVNSGENWGMAHLSSKTAQGQNRILALKDGGIQPLMGKTPVGRPSPSPSLLSNGLTWKPRNRQTHLHTDQVVALCLKPPITEHPRRRVCS